MLYNNWLHGVAQRFQERFDKILAVHNFDLGDEFEVALCEVLLDLLPRRFGVCRGFVVGGNGDLAGDDIIVFDAQRFPTIRVLANDLSRKEQIPAEAVLAYIEAKHTLIVEGDEDVGQSIAKATRQVEAVKAISRAAVSYREALNLGEDFGVEAPPGYPSIRNPYYAAIWARQLKSAGTEKDGPFNAFSRRMSTLSGTRKELPDAIVAGSSIAVPGVRNAQNVEFKPFLCEGTELVGLLNEIAPWGMALAHLLWAIEWLRLGDLPWGPMMAEQTKTKKMMVVGDQPIRGTKFRSP